MTLPITILNKLTAKDRPFSSPKFELQHSEGPPHMPMFYFTVSVRNIVAVGKGKSHKEAKQSAAQAALDLLTNSNGRACVQEEKPLLQFPAVVEHTLLDTVLSKIKMLDTKETSEIRNVCREIILFCTSQKRLEIFINNLYDCALTDRRFGHQAAIAISTTSVLSEHGPRFCIVLVKQLKKDFKNLENLQTTNPARFSNAASFLGQVCKFVPLGNGILTSLLLQLLKYQSQLAAGGPEEIELCVSLLALNSNILYKQYKNKLDELIFNMAICCRSNTLPLKSWMYLNVARHLHVSEYKPITGKLKMIFQKHLSPSAVDDINMLLTIPSSLPFERMDKTDLDFVNSEARTTHKPSRVMDMASLDVGHRCDRLSPD